MRETALFREDMEALRIVPPAHYIGAVESIPAIVDRVAELVDRGVGYRLEDGTGDVYFDLTAAPRFGYESHLDRDDDAGAARPSAAATRTGPASATRWTRCCGAAPATASRPGTAASLGPGRPGWHIECAVIALDRLGDDRSTCRAAATTCSTRTTSVRPRTPRCSPARAVRPALRARRHDRARRREDVEVQGQPGLRVPAARRRRRPDGDPAGPDLAALPRRPAVDRRHAQGGPAAAGHLARRGAGPGRAGRQPRCWPSCAPRSPTTWTPRGPCRLVDAWADAALAGVGADRGPGGRSHRRWTRCSGST